VQLGMSFREPRFASVSFHVTTEINCAFVRWTFQHVVEVLLPFAKWMAWDFPDGNFVLDVLPDKLRVTSTHIAEILSELRMVTNA